MRVALFLFLLFLNLINRSLCIDLTHIIEADSVIYTVRLGLSLKAECAVIQQYYNILHEKSVSVKRFFCFRPNSFCTISFFCVAEGYF